ncbi:hypothetical protein HDEF_2236 [Candidatus Hamiltonella defensa 5AT (Acyrthosiphon pisum)]|uniref:Uncharacterized protein n=1 Tax=Hamiltonella defensa subsp. Acyrthosiphon pisum (strain 5AT) TaxID=572265 RepID=C4K8C2_HAMD5|nr:hypothetical protein HDEF_2236 [Candidatus Hamiltonella defensa 5AT (Acyrthosiphon pisum)]
MLLNKFRVFYVFKLKKITKSAHFYGWSKNNL